MKEKERGRGKLTQYKNVCLITCLKLASIGAERGRVAINQIDLLIGNLE